MATRSIPEGAVVRVTGWRGTFRFHGLDRDGSAKLWGGSSTACAWRNAPLSAVRRPRRAKAPAAVGQAPASSRKAGTR